MGDVVICFSLSGKDWIAKVKKEFEEHHADVSKEYRQGDHVIVWDESSESLSGHVLVAGEPKSLNSNNKRSFRASDYLGVVVMRCSYCRNCTSAEYWVWNRKTKAREIETNECRDKHYWIVVESIKKTGVLRLRNACKDWYFDWLVKMRMVE